MRYLQTFYRVRRLHRPDGEVVTHVRKGDGIPGRSGHKSRRPVFDPEAQAPSSFFTVNHTFGKPDGPLGIGERLCNEPLIRGATYVHVYHVHFEMLEGGDAKCCHCGERFLEPKPETA